jgi:hypothetical protein
VNTLKKSSSELRKFGFTMAVPLLIIGGLMLWREREAWTYLIGLSAAFALFAIILPRALAPLEWAWMRLAHYMSIVMTYVILTLTFVLVITPTGILMRLFGKDPMERKFDSDQKSYWIRVPDDGPATRHNKPF